MLGLCWLAASVWAQGSVVTAHAVVDDTTNVMAVVAEADSYVEQEPNATTSRCRLFSTR